METGERREETHPQPLLKMSSFSSTPSHHIYSLKKQGLAIPLGCISSSETIRPTHCSFLIPGNSGQGMPIILSPRLSLRAQKKRSFQQILQLMLHPSLDLEKHLQRHPIS